MANGTRKVIDPETGFVVEVEVNEDSRDDAAIKRFVVAANIQRDLGFNIDCRHTSTVGAGKHTGSMRKAMAARSYVGTCSNKEARRRSRAIAARGVQNPEKRPAKVAA